jgi:GT2 family glycosyltransferase
MNDAYTKIESGNEYSYYNDCSGVFMFLSKETFKKVGYFNETYEYNGLEHIGYSARLRRSVGDPGYYCLDNTKKFIHSIDLDGNKEFNVFHRSTMEGLRGKALQLNQEVLTRELNNENLYYGSSISDKLVQ